MQKLAEHLIALDLEDCLCKFEYKPLGKLHNVNMGKGWVRTTTNKSCPHHNDHKFVGEGKKCERCRSPRETYCHTDSKMRKR